MVKNTTGGNKHKGHARKYTSVKAAAKLRIAEAEGELYGIVTRMLGNGMFYTHCIDNIVRLGHIRGKFSGRGKRDNFVEPGKWVLVGEREWDAKPSSSSSQKEDKKVIKCDLLEVYTELDKEKLMDKISENWSILLAQDVTKIKDIEAGGSDEVLFTTDKDEHYEKLVSDLAANKTKAIDLDTDKKEDEICWEDI